MADDLIFPHDDALSLIEGLSQNMLPEDTMTHDINPSFPMSELLNIPQIVPPVMSPNEDRKPFNTTGNVPLHNNGTQYTPISRLMKQTEQLAETLDGPLNTHINEQLKYTNSLSPNQNQVMNNSTNFNTSPAVVAARNSQCLVVGGQRIPIPLQQNPLPQNSISQNILPQNNSDSSSSAASMVPSPKTDIAPTGNNTKPPLILKLPPDVQNSKGGVKGQIVKTADQRLMFVTEVNGKRVGYLIQQSKQNATQPQQQSLRAISLPDHGGVGTQQTAKIQGNSNMNNQLINSHLHNPVVSPNPASQGFKYKSE